MHGAYITPYKLTWVASFRAALVGASGLIVGITGVISESDVGFC